MCDDAQKQTAEPAWRFSWRCWHIATQISFYCSLSRRSTNLSAMWCVMQMSFKILWTDPNEIPKCYSQHVKNLTHSNSFVAEDKVPHILFCSTCQWTSQTFSIFNRGHTISELGKPLQNLRHFHFLLPKCYFHHFESSCTFLPQFKVEMHSHQWLTVYAKWQVTQEYLHNFTIWMKIWACGRLPQNSTCDFSWLNTNRPNKHLHKKTRLSRQELHEIKY